MDKAAVAVTAVITLILTILVLPDSCSLVVLAAAPRMPQLVLRMFGKPLKRFFSSFQGFVLEP